MEAALILPLNVFVILGTLQLFMMMQGRVMAEYAAFRAVRAGSVNHGSCESMNHAAILALMPSYHSFVGNGSPGATPAEKLGNAFQLRRGGQYAGAIDAGHTGDIVWITRERPDPSIVPDEDREFDQPSSQAELEQLRRLEIHMVYWFPLRIPFANWVIGHMFLSQYGLREYVGKSNPLLMTNEAHWRQELTQSWGTEIENELVRRFDVGQYVIPLHASATMRMMTPARRVHFPTRACAPAPPTL